MNARPDPATIEIVRSRLLAAAEDMRVTLVRSAYTPTIYETEDCAVGLLDSDAEVLALSTGLPIFLGNLGQAVKDAVALRGGAGAMQPGDVFGLNDAYIQGTHMQDFTTFAPVFSADRLIGYAVARAHMVDLGSSEPGGGMATTSIYDEGLRLGPVRIFRHGQPVEDIIDVLHRNSRSGDELVGDIYAMASAVATGAQRLTEIAERWSISILEAVRDEIYAYSDAATRAAITAIPDGRYESSGCLDDDGIDVGVPVWIRVAATVEGDLLHVDLSGSSPLVRGAINCGLSQTISSIRVAIRLLLGGDRPPDGGAFRAITVSVPDGCFLNARPPAACGNYAASAVLLMDLVMRAFAQVIPHRVCAGQFGDAISELIWIDGDSGKPAVLGEAHAGGWGAGEGYEGADAVVDLTNGNFKNFPIELLEARYPVKVMQYGYRRGSEGAGRYRGGRGIARTYQIQEPASLYLWLDRVATPPWGLAGGMAGQPAYALLRSADGERTVLKCEGVELASGDELTICTAGGGGYGEPPTEAARPSVPDERPEVAV